MSSPYNHPSPLSTRTRGQKVKRYSLFGCGGCLGLVLLLFVLGGILAAMGLGGTTVSSTEASPSATASATPTPTSSPTPTAAEPSAISGEVLLGNADGQTERSVDGKAPRQALGDDIRALEALNALVVKGRAPKTGYDRGEFGESWLDIDGNGCDTRNDILNRDLTDIEHKAGTDGCKVASGVLDDPYTATTINFLAGPATSVDVQIDHVVALSDAWQKGAQQLDKDTRTLFANDPLNLLAVDGPTNQAKGDKDAASWLPPNKPFRCEYVSIQIAVKAKYELWITQAEKDAMKRVLSSCDGQTLPKDAGTVSGDAEALDTTPTPVVQKPKAEKKVEQPAQQPAFANCADAADAGRYNITSSDPRFSSDLDSDGDGVACERAGDIPAPAAPAPAAPVAPQPAAPVAPKPAPPVAPQPAAPAPVAGAPYANCTEVYASGESHLTPAHPRWNPRLDGRDNDGVGCENP